MRHRMWGQSEIRKILDKGKIDLSLCGHEHQQNFDTDKKGRGEIIAGSVTRNATSVIIEYNKNDDIFKIAQIDLKKET